MMHRGKVVLGVMCANSGRQSDRTLRVDVEVEHSWVAPLGVEVTAAGAAGSRLRLAPGVRSR